jgi:hypothetical protein
MVKDCRPTILHDEIDNVFKSAKADDTNATLLGILNQGYRPGATVPRCVGQGMNISVERMPCYCAVALAGLRKLPDTLASRSIFVHMKRRARDEKKEEFRRRYHPAEAKPIMDALMEWCQEIEAKVTGDEPIMPPGIEDRTADCWEPLLAIADALTGLPAPEPRRSISPGRPWTIASPMESNSLPTSATPSWKPTRYGPTRSCGGSVSGKRAHGKISRVGNSMTGA